MPGARSVAAVILATAVPLTAQSTAPRPSSPARPSTTQPAAENRALVIQYADGHRDYQLTRRAGSMWTTTFPKIDGAATDRDGLALDGLDFTFVVAGDGVDVSVALRYGVPHQRRVEAALVHVTPGRDVVIDQLTSFGVRPVTLSLVPITASRMFAPEVEVPSFDIEAHVDPVDGSTPAYRFTLINKSSRPLAAVEFKLYRGDREAGGGRRKTDRNTPLVEPGRQYAFALTAGNIGAPDWQPYSRVVVASVMWADGTVQGDDAPAKDEAAINRGAASQIDRVLELLRAASGGTAAQLETQLAELPVEGERGGTAAANGRQHVREAALKDLLRFRSSIAVNSFASWLAAEILEFENWKARLAPLAQSGGGGASAVSEVPGASSRAWGPANPTRYAPFDVMYHSPLVDEARPNGSA